MSNFCIKLFFMKNLKTNTLLLFQGFFNSLKTKSRKSHDLGI